MESRITELEIKLSYAEDLLDTLNATVYRQQQAIDLLQREIVALRAQLRSSLPEKDWSLRDEIPPHY